MDPRNSADAIDVLHVDDNPEMTELSLIFLERENDRITVHAAIDASEAQDAMAKTAFDCIVCDYDMPGLTGIQFLREVRESDEDLPFILFTGKGSEEVASDAIKAGVTDYLQKRGGSEQYELLANRIENAVTQHRATRESANIARVRRVTREAHKALVRAWSREDVEEEICRIFADAEPYRFAWICENDSESECIEPRASAGVEEGYLETIEITTNGESTGRGPTARAIRSHEISVVQNIPENGAYEPWREAAVERGYLSSAAIPLVCEGILYGTLNLYADRIDAFDEEERELLTELGEDTAHAIHRIEARNPLGAYSIL